MTRAGKNQPTTKIMTNEITSQFPPASFEIIARIRKFGTTIMKWMTTSATRS